MSRWAAGRPGAVGVLATLCLTLLLAAGQAPYDWAWSRGQHATPAQWKAHERYEQRGVGHHDPTASARTPEESAFRVGSWLVDGTHDAHQAAPDGVQARTSTAHELRPAPSWRRLAPLPAAFPRAPTIAPPVQPPQHTS